MKKYFLILTLLLNTVAVNAQTLQPLSVWMSERPNWAKDNSEVAYFSLRCNVLLTFVGAYFVNKSTDPSYIEHGKLVSKEAEAFTLPLMIFGQAAGYKLEDILKRSEKINKVYTSVMAANKDINNNIFDGFVEDDLKICRAAHETFASITRNIEYQHKEKRLY
jgi:hypothetical protein